MGLAFYCGSEFSGHEYDQFQELKKILISKYKDSEEEIVVLYNFFIHETQIDVALIMNNGILLIEMKDYEGEIYGDEEGDWYCKNSNGEEKKINSGSFPNPYIQCKVQRSRLTEKILELVDNKKLAEFPVEKQIISRSIRSWLYFNGSSTYKSNENTTENNVIKRNPWFNIVNAESLASEIDKIRSPFPIIKEDVDALVKSLNVSECGNKILPTKDLKNFDIKNEKLITIGQVDQKFLIGLNEIELQACTVEEFKGEYKTKSHIHLSLNVLNKKIEPSIKNLLYIAKFAFDWILYSIEKKVSDLDIKSMDGLHELNNALTKQYKIIYEPSNDLRHTSGGLFYGQFGKSSILISLDEKTAIFMDDDYIKIFNLSFSFTAEIWIVLSEEPLNQDEWGPFIDEDLAPRLKKFALLNPIEDLNISFFRKGLGDKKIKEGWFGIKIREFNAFIDGERFDLELSWSKDLDEELINKIEDTFVKISKNVLIGEYKDKRFRIDLETERRLVKLWYAPLAAEKEVMDNIYEEILPEGNSNT